MQGKTIALAARPLRDKTGKVDRILVSLTDVSEQVKVERENDDNKVTLRILQTRTGFMALLAQIKIEFEAMNSELSENGQMGVRMRLHTLNGNLRCFGLFELSSYVSNIESKDFIEANDLQGVKLEVINWVARHESVLKIKWEQSRDDVVHDLPESVLNHMESAAYFSKSLPAEAKEFIYKITNYTRSKTMTELLSPLVAMTSDLAMRLGKKVKLTVIGGDVRVHPSQFQPIFDALPHLIRNAIDHGIEDSATRSSRNKNEVASITLMIDVLPDNQIELTFGDDGEGIDPEKIAFLAVSKKLRTETQIKSLSSREKIALVLLPNFSTRDEVTEISGRGIGMGAVHSIIVNEFGGELELHSVLGHGTTVKMKFLLQALDLPKISGPTNEPSQSKKSNVA